MAEQPPKASDAPPPELPQIDGMSDVLATYLRTFSLWARTRLRAKMPIDEAQPKLLLLSPGGNVFSVTVSDAGALIATQVPLGKGSP